MTTHDADQTTLHEDLIAKIVVESLTQNPCDEDSHLPSWAYLAARTILAEFPEIGQPPQTTLHVPASDLPPRFTPSDTHIRAGLVDIGQRSHIDPALREKIELEIYRIGRRSWNGTTLSERVNKIMALIDAIAPAAQPQIDRDDIENLLDRYVFVSVEAGELESEKPGRYVAERDAIREQIIAHLNAAGAAQPLPTMTVSEFKSTASHHTLDILRKRVPVIVVPDEPEPQVDANLMTEEECVDWLNENVGVGMDKWFVSQPVISVRLARGTEPMMCAPDRLTAMRALVAKAAAQTDAG